MNKLCSCVAIFLLAVATSLAVVAEDASMVSQPLSVAGRWQMSWQARLGTEDATIELVQNGSNLCGVFHDPRHSSSLSGTIEGKNISFDVPFPGARPYTIAFKGTVDGDKITGASTARNISGSGAYLGHGGEIVQPEHPWSAIRQAEPPSLRTQKGKSDAPGNSK
jgi:hypothetical protein